MAYKFNPFTGTLDVVGTTTDRFVENGNTLELWWNGALVHSWTATPTAGTPIGLLLSLTQ